MKKIAVLGIGNRLMMDDGIGVYVVEELKKGYLTSYIDYIIGETDLDYCLDAISNKEFVVIIDAVDLGKESGEVTVIPIEKIELIDRGISLHDLHLFHFLANIKKDAKGVLIGIQPYSTDVHVGLSPILIKKYRIIIENISHLLRKSCFAPYLGIISGNNTFEET